MTTLSEAFEEDAASPSPIKLRKNYELFMDDDREARSEESQDKL